MILCFAGFAVRLRTDDAHAINACNPVLHALDATNSQGLALVIRTVPMNCFNRNLLVVTATVMGRPRCSHGMRRAPSRHGAFPALQAHNKCSDGKDIWRAGFSARINRNRVGGERGGDSRNDVERGLQTLHAALQTKEILRGLTLLCLPV